MNKMLNQKSMAVTAIATIMVFAIISSSFMLVDAKPENPGQAGNDKSQAPDLVCDGTYTGTESVFEGNVVVPEGALCNLYAMNGDILIKGDLKVAAGGDLYAFGKYSYDHSLTIEGSVMADGANEVMVSRAIIGGDVTIKFTVLGFMLSYSDVTGDVKLNSNYDSYSVVGNTIGGNLALSDNEGNGYGIYENFEGNDIAGNLQCKGNNPPPTADDLNTVGGKVTGQCDELV